MMKHGIGDEADGGSAAAAAAAAAARKVANLSMPMSIESD